MITQKSEKQSVESNEIAGHAAQTLTSEDQGSLSKNSMVFARPLAAGEIDVTVGKESGRASFELRQLVDGVAELVVNAESAAVRFASAVWVAASTLAKKPAFAAAGAAFGLGIIAEKSSGALIPDGANDAAYTAMGSDYAGNMALSFQVLVPGVGTGERDTTATYFNSEYAITAAHNVVDLLGDNPTYQVATGNNYLTNRGTVIPVESVTVYPGYDGTFNTPDLAIIKFAEPLEGISQTIEPASLGEILTGAGYGHHGSPSTGSLPQDGNIRAWNAPVVSGTTSNVSDIYYISTEFAASDDVTLNGKALSGDSGGPLFDSTGDLVGINIAQYGDTDAVGGTESLLLSEPAVETWIQQNTSVPEPSASVFVGATIAGLSLRRRRTPA